MDSETTISKLFSNGKRGKFETIIISGGKAKETGNLSTKDKNFIFVLAIGLIHILNKVSRMI
jgi:hypothetical protein